MTMKKGEVTHHLIFVIFEVLMALIVGATLFNYVTQIGKPERYHSLYLVNDASLYLSSLGIGENFASTYHSRTDTETGTFTIETNTPGSVSAYVTSLSNRGKERDYELQTTIAGPIQSFFLKESDTLTIKNGELQNIKEQKTMAIPFRYHCPKLLRKKILEEKMLYSPLSSNEEEYILDPGHGGLISPQNDPGIIFGEKNEAEMVRLLALRLTGMSTRSLSIDESITLASRMQRIMESKKPFVSLHIGTEPGTVQILLAHTDEFQPSMDIACNLANTLSPLTTLKHVSIHVVEPQDLTDEHTQILTLKHPGILLLIGNIEDTFITKNEFTEALIHGLEE